MKRIFTLLLFIVFSLTAKADHITGGEMYYTFLGVNGSRYDYAVTMKLFMRCNSGRQFPDPAIISVFDKVTSSRVQDISAVISRRETIAIGQYDPCISNPPTVCYEVAYYQFTVSVPASPGGYVLASMVNYRIRGISNLENIQVGATYTCDIPGNSEALNGPQNNSAVFTGSDLVVVCAGNYFSYSFAASDPDNDNIHYSFCAAYASSTGGNGVPANPPPYASVPYTNTEYFDSSPLGSGVTINPNTGLITGIAPPGGVYVVTVCAQEMRGNVVIATQRKDIQINVADCSIAAAILEKDYMLCGSTRSVNISNLSNSPLIISYDWDVYNPGGSSIHSATTSSLNYTFPANGTYMIRLIVNRGKDCSDTTTALAYVYPGLVPDFDTKGICITKPTLFTDRTSLQSGAVNSWRWDFGDITVSNDVSTNQNTSYTYPTTGIKDVRLIVTTTDGCRDTVNKLTTVIDKPPIILAFADTLICVNDVVQLHASGTGVFTWSPPVNMINAATSSPTVSPAATTKYYVDLDEDGCRNRDSVMVNVVDQVTLRVMSDTTICRNDTIQLHISSDGLRYNWTPAAQALDPTAKNPFVITSPALTPYQVTATIGGCSATASIRVTTVAYPSAHAGADTMICYNTAAQLHGSTDGNNWLWTPGSSLSNDRSLNPVAHPVALLTPYVFTTRNTTSGCPKPSSDTVYVTMLPKIKPFAGRDTAVVINQPLQMNAAGGFNYTWEPPRYLSNAEIGNPVALFTTPSEGIRYKVYVYNEAGCVDTASFKVTVFATGPTVFVPTGFTPNNDGRNDVLIPVAVGMKYIQNFSVFNRWGQLVFSTGDAGHGWDGRVTGQFQGTNSYIWMVKAVDFNGKPYFLKGMVTLIR